MLCQGLVNFKKYAKPTNKILIYVRERGGFNQVYLSDVVRFMLNDMDMDVYIYFQNDKKIKKIF